jgi:hypothetical protein
LSSERAQVQRDLRGGVESDDAMTAERLDGSDIRSSADIDVGVVGGYENMNPRAPVCASAPRVSHGLEAR